MDSNDEIESESEWEDQDDASEYPLADLEVVSTKRRAVMAQFNKF